MNGGKCHVLCFACGQDHHLSPSALALVIEAFQSGDLQTLGEDMTVRSLCILTALANLDPVIATRKYKGAISWTV